MDAALNVLGGRLETCSAAPLTGFYRDGCCNTGPEDQGRHTVCVIVSDEFLALSKYLGNDLSTPRPEFRFPGLKPGDRWCRALLAGGAGIRRTAGGAGGDPCPHAGHRAAGAAAGPCRA